MPSRRTAAKGLKRTTATRPERKTVVIFCEGKASEPDYISALKRLPAIRANTAINIEIAPEWGVPLELVKCAVERSQDDEVDECWCVFDVEWPQNHPNLAPAIRLAEKHGIRLVISNPCFELWLILHHERRHAFMSTKDAERRSRELDGREGKRLDADRYMDRRHVAARNAADLAARHQRDETAFPHDNPSTNMHELLKAIEPNSP
ncbi:RloB family protein [Sphaerisporangium rubeum]|uniref:RloB domain-containing protein n=1 Tax=Sphaerisporangium rubeum TaxID=321317 RepID=A0A7X0M4I9_9ACTN|nr:RloB family protein [Sphaerisporangium rubeum]MBB6471197.1 hypothetical protein [Sphaerisporangium rubeum]